MISSMWKITLKSLKVGKNSKQKIIIQSFSNHKSTFLQSHLLFTKKHKKLFKLQLNQNFRCNCHLLKFQNHLPKIIFKSDQLIKLGQTIELILQDYSVILTISETYFKIQCQKLIRFILQEILTLIMIYLFNKKSH